MNEEENIIDTTDTASDWQRVHKADDEAARLAKAKAEPEMMELQIGSLRIVSRRPAVIGTDVFVNGKPFPIKGIHIYGHVETDPVWRVELEYYPGLTPKEGQ
jgi:hypothetical protein